MDWPGLLEGAVKARFVVGVWLQLVPLLVWAKRKVSAWIQERETGPNRSAPGACCSRWPT